MTNAKILPVPEEATKNLVRVAGTSIGKIASGNFKNYKTGKKFRFYLTGKGEKLYFELDGKNYLIDNVSKVD